MGFGISWVFSPGIMMVRILEKLAQRKPLQAEDWVQIAERAPSADLFEMADRFRKARHPDGIVTYVVDRNINYTNVCLSGCAFCAFYCRPDSAQGYLLTREEVCHKVEETLERGGSGILLQGGLNPAIPRDYFEGLLRHLKSRYPIYLHCFSPPEIQFYSRLYGFTPEEYLARLRDAGLDSIPGGGAEILDDTVRTRLSQKGSAGEWLAVMRTAHRLGLRSTATMVIGLGEGTAQRLAHLERLRDLQAETAGFLSFIPWTFQPRNTALETRIPEAVQGEPYLRWLAVGRLYLDNFEHVQVSRLTQGMETARRGLRCGADDLGSVMMEENVVAAAGAGHHADEEALRQAILQEGFTPWPRNAGYRRLDKDRAPQPFTQPVTH